MTQVVDWGNISDDSGNFDNENQRPKVDWLRVPDNGRARVRLVSLPVEYRKYWDPIMAYSPGKENGDPLFDAGYKPSRNYGLWIIDRTDGSLKVYNCSKKILMMFKEWSQIRNVDPHDAEKGVDWVISKKKSDGKWQYNATPVDEAPLTEDEKARVEKTLEEKPLVKVFKPHTPEELQEMLDSYKSNPDGPTPGTGKWYKAIREAANGGSAQAATTGGVNFDDDSNLADISDDNAGDSQDDDSYEPLFNEEQAEGSSDGGASLF